MNLVVVLYFTEGENRMMIINRKVIRMALLVAVLGTVCAACSNTVTSATKHSTAKSLGAVTFGTSALPASVGLVTAVINKYHLDTKNEFQLVTRDYSPADAETALLTGQVDSSFFSYVDWAKLKERNITLIAPLQDEHGGLITLSGSPYTSLASLKGRAIATIGPVSANYNDMQIIAAKQGLNFQTQFSHLTAPPPLLATMLVKGEASASVSYQPLLSSALATGKFRLIFGLNNEWRRLTGSDLYMLAVAARSSWYQSHKKLAAALGRAFMEAEDILATKGPKIIKEYAKEEGLTSSRALSLAEESWPEVFRNQAVAKADVGVTRELKVAKDAGIIPSVPHPIFG